MLNQNMKKIEKKNTFSMVTKKIKEYKEKHPDKDVVSLGIGDVCLPVCKPIIDAMHQAVDDLSTMEHFQGYGAYYGLTSLRELILKNDYKGFGFLIDEVYVGDGTKSDCSSILEVFDKDSKILTGEPLYPIYKNSCYSMSRDVYEGKLDENQKMLIPSEHYDLIYLCSPSNPTGVTYNYEDLTKWVKYALKNKAVILYDNVYEAFITSKDVPHSIYEIKGAKKCAIEFRSFSKKASFTGLRCSYFILPKGIDKNIIEYWKERTINRFNGASYVAQKGAEASFSLEAKKIIKENMKYYHKTTTYLRKEFSKLGFKVQGGVDGPYLWIKTNMPSWKFFKLCLEELNVIITPGIIFGESGDEYARISGLGTYENAQKAIERFKKYYEK